MLYCYEERVIRRLITYHGKDDLRLRIVGLRNFEVSAGMHLEHRSQHTLPSDTDDRPGRGRCLGHDPTGSVRLVELLEP